MDPAIANQDFDPPAQRSSVWRSLLPALLVNVLFVIALGWSVPWSRSTSPEPAAASPAGLGTMGGPPAATAPTQPATPPSPSPVATTASLPPPPARPAEPPARSAAEARAPLVASVTPRPAPAPSFDCAKARSRTEKLICADPELAQLDRDLGRLNVRARSLSPDPAAFRRAGDAEWKRREAECRDKACLLDWYAQRRAQLEAVVAERS